MYDQGNFPPPYRPPSQLQAPNQMGPNPPYPAPTGHSYSIPHSTQHLPQQAVPPPPPRLPYPPQQQFYQSHTNAPPNFFSAPPLPSSTIPPPPPSLPPPPMPLPPPEVAPITTPVAMPAIPPPPPPPSLPPPPMPPPPPEVASKPIGEEVVPDRESLHSASYTTLEKREAGPVSPALSDMDMEDDDDDVPDSNKETNHCNGEILLKPSSGNKESDVVKDIFHGSQCAVKEHVEEPLPRAQSITKDLRGDTNVLINACLPQLSPHDPAAGDFTEDVSSARSSLTPVECVIDASMDSKPENPNSTPFQLLQQDYGSLDSGEEADDPSSDKEIADTDKNNVKHECEEKDDSKLNETRNLKRLESKGPSESPRKRMKSPQASNFPTQQTEMSPLGTNPADFASSKPGPVSAPDQSQQIWPHLPPPPPPPLAPHMQLVSTLHPTNFVAPYPPVEPPQMFPLPFPSHAERWPAPSVSAPLSLPPSFPSSTSAGAALSSSTLVPSFTGSTITTRYNPYASTFETIPPLPSFSISSNLPGHGFSTNYSTSYGTAKHSTLGTPYDPLSDSIEPIKKSNPLLVPDQLSSKPATEPEADELGEEVVGTVENVSPEPVANPGPSGTVTITGSNEKNKDESRSMKLFKVALADYVKEVLKPAWRQGNISKDAFKIIVKKTVDKVSASVPSHHIPKTPAKINQYVEASQKKVTKLVMSYVDKYVKKQL